MAHPLVDQLAFTRSEWRRGLRGTSPVGALARIEPMNSIGWIVGHLAWHEQRYWLTRAQGQTPVPELNELVASGGPAMDSPRRPMSSGAHSASSCRRRRRAAPR
ncbi:MAG: DinB family protein, partial [Candidatus Limnocylindrales bacterium]